MAGQQFQILFATNGTKIIHNLLTKTKMKKTILLLLITFIFISCKKTDLIPEVKHDNQLPQNPLAFNWKKIITFDSMEIYSEVYNVTIYDSCAGENITLSGLETYKLKQSPTLTPYYIYYEIDLTGVTGLGEVSGNKYHGGGKIIGIVVETENKSFGKVSYKVKYSCKNDVISFSQKAVFYQVNGKVKIDFNSGFIESCKSKK